MPFFNTQQAPRFQIAGTDLIKQASINPFQIAGQEMQKLSDEIDNRAFADKLGKATTFDALTQLTPTTEAQQKMFSAKAEPMRFAEQQRQFDAEQAIRDEEAQIKRENIGIADSIGGLLQYGTPQDIKDAQSLAAMLAGRGGADLQKFTMQPQQKEKQWEQADVIEKDGRYYRVMYNKANPSETTLLPSSRVEFDKYSKGSQKAQETWVDAKTGKLFLGAPADETTMRSQGFLPQKDYLTFKEQDEEQARLKIQTEEVATKLSNPNEFSAEIADEFEMHIDETMGGITGLQLTEDQKKAIGDAVVNVVRRYPNEIGRPLMAMPTAEKAQFIKDLLGLRIEEQTGYSMLPNIFGGALAPDVKIEQDPNTAILKRAAGLYKKRKRIDEGKTSGGVLSFEEAEAMKRARK